jgi:hypothetical protein
MSIEHRAKGIGLKPWGARGKSLTDVLQNAKCKMEIYLGKPFSFQFAI